MNVDANKRETVDVKIFLTHPDAVIPAYAKPGDMGMDLTAVSITYDQELDCYVYDTGIKVAIPEGYAALIFPRSSNRKTDAYQTNAVGIIDSGYRGTILVCYKNRTSFWVKNNLNRLENIIKGVYNKVNNILNNRFKVFEEEHLKLNDIAINDAPYKVGERIAQMVVMPYPHCVFSPVEDVADLGQTVRGAGGHGSTGN